MSWVSSRKFWLESSGFWFERFGFGLDYSESDDEIFYKLWEYLFEIVDFIIVDINDEKVFDIDLEDKGISLLLLKG